MDISMPEMNGLEVTGVVSKDVPEVKVLVLSVHNNGIHFPHHSGWSPWLYFEGSGTGGSLRAIESVYAGEPFFSPEIAKAALTQIITSGGKKDPFAQLTVENAKCSC